jgi:hypothetical protein
MLSSQGSDPIKSSRFNNVPTGKVPLLPEVDDEVDWTMVGILMRAF